MTARAIRSGMSAPVAGRALVVLLSGSVLGAELINPVAPPVIEKAILPPQAVGADASRNAAIPVAGYSSIGQMPLFHASRAPWVPPPPVSRPQPVNPAPPPAPIAPPRGYRLIGIVMTDDARTALVQASGGKVLRLTEKALLDGWTVIEITRHGLRLQANQALFEITFPKHP